MRGLKVAICALLALASSSLAIDDYQNIVAGHQNFGRELFKQFSLKRGNVVVSPLSAYLALAVARLGAGGQTEREISNVLSLSSGNQHAEGFTSLHQSLAAQKENSRVAVANKIFLNDKFSLSPKFNQDASRIFHTTADRLNFIDARATSDIMNNWVRNVTKNRINSIADGRGLNADTKAIIVNVMYFRSPWKYPFYNPSEPRPFFVDQTNSVNTYFISKEDDYGFANLQDLDAKLIELPYKDPDFSFIVLLPNQRGGLAQLEGRMAGANIVDLLQQTRQEEITLNLPKFQIDLGRSLIEPLQNMGIKSVFSDSADLSGISGIPGDRLRVSDVFQKTYFGINENGTEAAASTSIQVVAISAKLKEHIINCDHPFLFYLMHKRSITLFQGRFVDPRA